MLDQVCNFVNLYFQIYQKKVEQYQNMFPLKKRDQVYQAEDILDEAVINNEPHYLIKWEGLPHQYDTWEPISSLGNILQFLKFWLKEKQAKQQAKSKQKLKSNFDQVKPYVDREYFQPKRKSVRQQYEDEQKQEKRKLDLQKLGKKILKQKKTWQKYLDYDQRHINLIQEDEKQMQGLQEKEKYINASPSQAEKMQDQSQENKKNYIKNEEFAQQGKVIKLYEQPSKVIKQEAKPKQAVKVIDYIDPTKITKICKIFNFKGIKCVEVQCANGKHINMKQQELRIVQPILVMEYYQTNKIPI